MKNKIQDKYDFDTGKPVKMKKVTRYKMHGKRKIGTLQTCNDNKKAYYILYEDFDKSPISTDLSIFEKVESVEQEEDYMKNYVLKQKPKNKLVFNTKIDYPKRGKTLFINTYPEIKLGKLLLDDYITYFRTIDSNIIRELQLKKGDKVRVTFEKI